MLSAFNAHTVQQLLSMVTLQEGQLGHHATHIRVHRVEHSAALSFAAFWKSQGQIRTSHFNTTATKAGDNPTT
jgi:hypothetical protein